MKTEHTQTPWKLNSVGTSHNIRGVAEPGLDLHVAYIAGRTDEENKANADHIVRCVNQHDALVAALVAAKARLEEIEHKSEGRWQSFNTLSIVEHALQSPAPETK